MVLYYYPPSGGTSMSRNARNVQYLPRYGWRPTVLTPRNAAFHLLDERSRELIPPETRVVRTPILEAGHVRPMIVSMLGRLRRAGAGVASRFTSGSGWIGSSGPDVQARPSGLERLRQAVFFPDDQIAWLPFALAAALRAHRAAPFDAVYSTSSPITSHLIAGLFSRWTGVPWVAEFRDPWVGNALGPRLPWLHRRLRAKLERWIVGSADRVVGVSPGITQLYRKRYPDAPEMVTITSGYDRTEAAKQGSSERLGTPRAGARFRIVYTGTLDRPDELAVFLEGVDRLIGQRPELRTRISIAFFGFATDACRAIAEKHAAGRLDGIVELRGFVPRVEALEAVAAADAALILLGQGPGMGLFIPGKLFDYLGQNVQILAMLPPGDSREILESLQWGVICDPDPGQVAAAVERLISLPPPARPADPAGTYDRVRLAGALAASLDAVTTRRRDIGVPSVPQP
jgi:glycosyltransferase involved in cell wall biosynthesis